MNTSPPPGFPRHIDEVYQSMRCSTCMYWNDSAAIVDRYPGRFAPCDRAADPKTAGELGPHNAPIRVGSLPMLTRDSHFCAEFLPLTNKAKMRRRTEERFAAMDPSNGVKLSMQCSMVVARAQQRLPSFEDITPEGRVIYHHIRDVVEVLQRAYLGTPFSHAVELAGKHLAVVNALLDLAALPPLPLLVEEMLLIPTELEVYMNALIQIVGPFSTTTSVSSIEAPRS